MIHIVVAIHLEARPLIDHFGLKRDTTHNTFEIFKNDEIALILSGIGKVPTAIATTYLLSKLEPLPSSIFNLGFCGAKIEYPIGDMYLANRITDHSTRRQYYSDIILRHDLAEASLETFDQAVTDKGFDNPNVELVDMEASGFFEAASRFLSPDRIYCLKIISDHLECGTLSKDLADSLIGKNLPKIEEFIVNYATLDRGSAEVISAPDLELLIKLKSHLKLTVTQSLELRKLAHGFIARGGESLAALQKFLSNKISNKEDGKRALSEIKALLA